jgi:hypothetical protein
MPQKQRFLRFSLILTTAAGFAASSCGGDDGSPSRPGATESSQDDTTSASSASEDEIVCVPGEKRCSGETFLETCAPTGREWTAVACGDNSACVPCEDELSCTEDRCLGPCELQEDLPSSAGCSFIANRQLHVNEASPDGLVVANPSQDLSATIYLYKVPEGKRKEELEEGPIVLEPGEGHVFQLMNTFVQGSSSMFRTGGMYRLVSDAPVLAYQHAPWAKDIGNDSTLLFPESALRSDYVVVSYAPLYAHLSGVLGYGLPSYFEVIALEDQTTVTWTPRADTAGNGLPISPVSAGQTGTQKMNKFDTMRIAASVNWIHEGGCEYWSPGDSDPGAVNRSLCHALADVSGTVVSADKPIWIVAGSRSSRVPVRELPANGFSDPLQEFLIPIEYWGREYVAVRSPVRDREEHHWRVYAGADDVTVSVDPPLAEADVFSFQSRGEYVEFSVPNDTSFVLSGDGPFMPVQYLQSQWRTGEPDETSAVQYGNPSMYQTVPVEQFLGRYVFATGLNFDENYVQVIRKESGGAVRLDGEELDDQLFQPVGEYEFADVQVQEGVHQIESDGPFGIVQVGYTVGVSSENCPNPNIDPPTCHSSYAYIGGMSALRITIP